MLADVDSLRATGIVVAILTNGTDTIPAEMVALGLGQRFDAIFNSADHGVAKPDRRIFEIVCEGLGSSPSDIFFTDDSASNLTGASAVGMTVQLFTGVQAFRSQLAELGIAQRPH